MGIHKPLWSLALATGVPGFASVANSIRMDGGQLQKLPDGETVKWELVKQIEAERYDETSDEIEKTLAEGAPVRTDDSDNAVDVILTTPDSDDQYSRSGSTSPPSSTCGSPHDHILEDHIFGEILEEENRVGSGFEIPRLAERDGLVAMEYDGCSALARPNLVEQQSFDETATTVRPNKRARTARNESQTRSTCVLPSRTTGTVEVTDASSTPSKTGDFLHKMAPFVFPFPVDTKDDDAATSLWATNAGFHIVPSYSPADVVDQHMGQVNVDQPSTPPTPVATSFRRMDEFSVGRKTAQKKSPSTTRTRKSRSPSPASSVDSIDGKSTKKVGSRQLTDAEREEFAKYYNRESLTRYINDKRLKDRSAATKNEMLELELMVKHQTFSGKPSILPDEKRRLFSNDDNNKYTYFSLEAVAEIVSKCASMEKSISRGLFEKNGRHCGKKSGKADRRLAFKNGGHLDQFLDSEKVDLISYQTARLDQKTNEYLKGGWGLRATEKAFDIVSDGSVRYAEVYDGAPPEGKDMKERKDICYNTITTNFFLDPASHAATRLKLEFMASAINFGKDRIMSVLREKHGITSVKELLESSRRKTPPPVDTSVQSTLAERSEHTPTRPTDRTKRPRAEAGARRQLDMKSKASANHGGQPVPFSLEDTTAGGF